MLTREEGEGMCVVVGVQFWRVMGEGLHEKNIWIINLKGDKDTDCISPGKERSSQKQQSAVA